MVNDTVDKIWFLDLKLGNICNLKCRICGSWSSSKWAAEEIDYLKQEGVSRKDVKSHTAYQMLREGAWPRNSDVFWDSLEEILPYVEYFEFTGGEPFMIQEHFELLKRAADLGYAGNIDLHYNTNGTVYPEFILEVWQKFNSVEIAFSIDNVGKRFEYERYLANWDDVNSNIKKFKKLKNTSKNIDLQLCFTVNILNVLYLNELLDWAETIGFDTVHWNMLHGPEELSIASIPNNIKHQFIDQIKQHKYETKHCKEIDNVINMIIHGTPIDIKYIHERIRKTDAYRNQNLIDHHSELAKLLNYE